VVVAFVAFVVVVAFVEVICCVVLVVTFNPIKGKSTVAMPLDGILTCAFDGLTSV
jgi:hypothetical protein